MALFLDTTLAYHRDVIKRLAHGRWPTDAEKRAKRRAMLELSREYLRAYARAAKRQEGSKGAASKVHKIEVTPELQAKYVPR